MFFCEIRLRYWLLFFYIRKYEKYAKEILRSCVSVCVWNKELHNGKNKDFLFLKRWLNLNSFFKSNTSGHKSYMHKKINTWITTLQIYYVCFAHDVFFIRVGTVVSGSPRNEPMTEKGWWHNVFNRMTKSNLKFEREIY